MGARMPEGWVYGHRTNEPITDKDYPRFIAGPMRSGTTLMADILGSHRHVYKIPVEARLTTRLWDIKGDPIVKGQVVYAVYKALCDHQPVSTRDGQDRKMKRRFWIEKTPNYGQDIDRLIKMFPFLKILCMQRDIRDIACSIRRISTKKSWQDCIRLANNYQINARRPKKLGPEMYREFWLEHLILYKEQVLKAACEFFDLDWDEELMKYPVKSDVMGQWETQMPKRFQIFCRKKYPKAEYFKNEDDT